MVLVIELSRLCYRAATLSVAFRSDNCHTPRTLLNDQKNRH